MDQKFYEDLLEAMAEGVYFVDTDRRITYWNKSAERLTGYAAKEVIGKSCADNLLRHVDDEGTELCGEGCPLAATIKDGQVRIADVYAHHKYGHRVPVKVRASPMRDEFGAIIGAVEVFTENSEHINILKEVERLRKEVLTDKLTGVGNRRYAEIVMESLDQSMERDQVPFGVIMADIDHFKDVNDKWGHGIGDRVLTMVAQSLVASLRPFDVACRWGGEEFLILIPNAEHKHIETIGQRLRMLVENSWIVHEGDHIKVTASFGGAISKVGELADDVITRADAALYVSKESGRNCVMISDVTESCAR